MIQLSLHPANLRNTELRSWIETRVAALPDESIVKLRVHGRMPPQAMAVLNAAALRSLAPPTMNIDAVFVDYAVYRRPGKGDARR